MRPVRYRFFLVVLAYIVLFAAPVFAWDLHPLHPFAEMSADQLAESLMHSPPILKSLTLQGLKNDWVHNAFAVSAEQDEKARVHISLEGTKALKDAVRLRVLGFVRQKGVGWAIDTVFDSPAKEFEMNYKSSVRNIDNILEFPDATATQRDPLVVWLTAHTKGLKTGKYRGRVVVSDGVGKRVRIPVTLRVGNYELPEENPLITCGWQWMSIQKFADVFHEYGINATHCYSDFEIARKAGFRFYIFTFQHSWNNLLVEKADDAGVDREIAQFKEVIHKYDLKSDQWALYITDEPNDSHTDNQIAWCKYIRSKWPEARFMFNPGWGPGPKNDWSSVEGLVKPLLPYGNIWMPYHAWLSDDSAPESINLMKQHADQVWFYEIMGFSYGRKPSVGRSMYRSIPWTAWKHRLQGVSWYSLNAYENPWSDMSDGQEQYGSMYGCIPARSIEALRQGLQEYKRFSELRKMGHPAAEIDKFADRMLIARRVEDIDIIREDMDALIVTLARKLGRH